MTKKISKHQIDIINLLRVVFAFFIMLLHYQMFTSNDVPGTRARSAWIFVEAFFMLTGYFTTKHFRKTRKIKMDELAKDSLSYTFKKFSTFLPYIIIALLIGFIYTFMYRDYTPIGFVIEFCKLPLELLFGSAFIPTSHCGPLWYLSAMFIVFPLFCLLVSIKKYKNIRTIFFLFIASLFLLTGTEADRYFLSLYRAFSSLVLGSLTFEAASLFSKKKLSRAKKIFLQICESLSFLFIIFIVMQHGNIIASYIQVRFCVLLAFFVMFMLIFSGQTYVSKIRIPFADILGAISLPLFLNHLSVFLIVIKLGSGLNPMLMALVSFTSSILVSLISLVLINKIKRN